MIRPVNRFSKRGDGSQTIDLVVTLDPVVARGIRPVCGKGSASISGDRLEGSLLFKFTCLLFEFRIR
jgi:hypothetical protein